MACTRGANPRKRKHIHANANTHTRHTYAILMKIPPLNVKAALALARASQSAIATDKYRMPASKSDTCAQVLEIGS